MKNGFGKSKIQKCASALMAALLAALCLSGCNGSKEVSNENGGSSGDDKISVVATIFPEYDWAREIIGDNTDNVELTYLLENGVDLHSYQPTADDMVKISDCDIFIYVGGSSDGWVEDAVKNAENKNMKVIDLMDVLGSSVKTEETKEGMQEDEEEEDEDEYDEHVWLSVKNAELFCTEIAFALSDADPDNKDDYNKNLKDYIIKLNKLDGAFSSLANKAENKTIVVADRYPFRYFTDDYGLDYYAAFAGCSSETDASFETVAFLAKKIDELGVNTVFILENSDNSISEAVIRSTKKKDQQAAVLNSIQSVTKEQIDGGITYLSLMQENYDVLKTVLK